MKDKDRIRSAIVGTAYLFRRDPRCMDFKSNSSPGGSVTRGSPLGWIGLGLGFPRGTTDAQVAAAMGTTMTDFYARVGELARELNPFSTITEPTRELNLALLRYAEARFGHRREMDQKVSWAECAWMPPEVRA